MLKLSIPNEVTIGGVTYTVRRNVPRLFNGCNSVGEIDYDKSVIEIRDIIYGTQREEETFLHEVLHGICDAWSLDNVNKDKTIDALAHGLLAFMKNNPGVFRNE